MGNKGNNSVPIKTTKMHFIKTKHAIVINSRNYLIRKRNTHIKLIIFLKGLLGDSKIILVSK